VNQREWLLVLLDRFPVLDLTWSADIQYKWWRCYELFWRWTCRLIVYEAIDELVKASKPMVMTELQYASLVISLSTLGQVDLRDNESEQLRTLAHLLSEAHENVRRALGDTSRPARIGATITRSTFSISDEESSE
jgi:hypothetical protein